jgi:hypothetical protein
MWYTCCISFQTEPGCPCLLGTMPDEFAVTINGIANGICIHCVDLNGTFICSRLEGQTCVWKCEININP